MQEDNKRVCWTDWESGAEQPGGHKNREYSGVKWRYQSVCVCACMPVGVLVQRSHLYSWCSGKVQWKTNRQRKFTLIRCKHTFVTASTAGDCAQWEGVFAVLSFHGG